VERLCYLNARQSRKVAPRLRVIWVWPGALLVAPGLPDKSLVLLRMQALDEHRMPPLASHVVDQVSVDVLTNWIASLSSCP